MLNVFWCVWLLVEIVLLLIKMMIGFLLIVKLCDNWLYVCCRKVFDWKMIGCIFWEVKVEVNVMECCLVIFILK